VSIVDCYRPICEIDDPEKRCPALADGRCRP
jgi:hypothetical protein